jgi:hypothetical protein
METVKMNGEGSWCEKGRMLKLVPPIRVDLVGGKLRVTSGASVIERPVSKFRCTADSLETDGFKFMCAKESKDQMQQLLKAVLVSASGGGHKPTRGSRSGVTDR